MIEFVLFSRRGRTNGNFRTLREAGRLDVVHQCLLTAFFTSGALRRDVVFHAVLGGPPRPPVHLIFDGASLRDVRTDEKTWEEILRKVLSGGVHQGIECGEKLPRSPEVKTECFRPRRKRRRHPQNQVGRKPSFCSRRPSGTAEARRKVCLAFRNKDLTR